MTTNIKTLLFVCVMSFSLQTFSQDWTYNFNEAVQESKKSDKLVMLVFQGSDWCAPCIKLEKKIWQSEQFKTYSKESLVIVKLDFPRKKVNQLADFQKEHNNKMAEKFNTNGYFPLVVILNNKEEILDRFGYENWSPETYIKRIDANNLK
jgi:thioredoxin-related protein